MRGPQPHEVDLWRQVLALRGRGHPRAEVARRVGIPAHRVRTILRDRGESARAIDRAAWRSFLAAWRRRWRSSVSVPFLLGALEADWMMDPRPRLVSPVPDVVGLVLTAPPGFDRMSQLRTFLALHCGANYGSPSSPLVLVSYYDRERFRVETTR